ncbi:hypothetical protein D3C87_460130 [compost metagenome]
MASNFKHSPNGLVLGNTRTLLYGPVPVGTTAIIFSGTFPNLDNTNKLQQTVTVETYDGSTYTMVLNSVPIPYGSASKCPKIVLYAGESLYGTAGSASLVGANVGILERV